MIGAPQWTAIEFMHAQSAEGVLHIRCLADFLHRRHLLRLFFFLRPPCACVVCDREKTLGRAATTRLDDPTTTRSRRQRQRASSLQTLLFLRPRLVLVPPWVTIEFGPFKHLRSPIPAAHLAFTIPFAHPNFVHALAAYPRTQISAVLLHSLYTQTRLHLPILLNCSALLCSARHPRPEVPPALHLCTCTPAASQFW